MDDLSKNCPKKCWRAVSCKNIQHKYRALAAIQILHSPGSHVACRFMHFTRCFLFFCQQVVVCCAAQHQVQLPFLTELDLASNSLSQDSLSFCNCEIPPLWCGWHLLEEAFNLAGAPRLVSLAWCFEKKHLIASWTEGWIKNHRLRSFAPISSHR